MNTKVLSMKPRKKTGQYRTDGIHPDKFTMIPWEMGEQLVLDVTVVNVLQSSRLNQGSLCNPGIVVKRLK